MKNYQALYVLGWGMIGTAIGLIGVAKTASIDDRTRTQGKVYRSE